MTTQTNKTASKDAKGVKAPKKNKTKKIVSLLWACFLGPIVLLVGMLWLTAAGVFGRMPSF
jgi:cell division septal protein FtsQ